MFQIFRQIADRILVKVLLLVGARLDAAVEMELGDARAELLTQADSLEKKGVEGFDELASRLRTRALSLGAEKGGPAAEALELTRLLGEEDLRSSAAQAALGDSRSSKKSLMVSTGSTPKRRGRPPKNASSQLRAQEGKADGASG